MIADRLAALRAAIPAGVTLVAVSKTQPPEAVREAYAAGQRDFGENYAQEWRAKADALADLPDLRWHFIGGLQTNKVKYLAGRVHAVHTVDRPELARELSKRFAARAARVKVFVEVNVGGEASKEGCAPAEVPALAAAVRALPALELVGLMCVPPAEGDPRPHFRLLRRLRDELGLAELSMGMSGDWQAAVEEGSTLVRIGTAIFGARPPKGTAP
ncbi:MAG TPA: YggS family pyridoxal phosphate-dependent enzyme [Anaeromyxobacter sp.]|nr:YggS family pyridoxal phosphate-dependent enzyme [Anaeromyxobacter sp.]